MKNKPKIEPLDWDSPSIRTLIRATLDEDLRGGGRGAAVDLTSEALVPQETTARAQILAKQEVVVAGLPLAERVFRALEGDTTVRFEARAAEGSSIEAGTTIAEIQGNARAILSAERTALNFLGRLCGIATLTRRFVEAVAGTGTQIRDTRKTTPLLRMLEKYAVRAGGGVNHRFGLYDAILIKENHVAIAGGIREALERARKQTIARPVAAGVAAPESVAFPDATFPEMTAYEAFAPPDEPGDIPIEIEVRNEEEFRQALAISAGFLLLDNFTPEEVARAVREARRIAPNAKLEVSGGITLGNVRAYAEAGVDFVSIGALTHSAPAADLSLLVEPAAVG